MLKDEESRPPPPGPLDGFRADRVYLGADHARNERRVWLAAAICTVSLTAQLVGGLAFNSMALLAGGIHMAAHVAALSVAGLAYLLARRYAADRRFSFGAGKVGYLAAFANAVALGITALVLAVESLTHFTGGPETHYHEASQLAFAVLGVNLLCMWLLRPAKGQHAQPDDADDVNLRGAHLHLAADVVVSILSIAGLLAGGRLGWTWADPLAGLLGALLVGRFAWSLGRSAGAVLLDITPSPRLAGEARARLEAMGARVIDLHLWRLGPGHHAAIAVVADPQARPAQAFRAQLADLAGLSHLTVEVRAAPETESGESPVAALTRKSASV
ncbi:MAG: CDF family Co(II)/Ni(II) efflux transporter DmeF [Phenylobacterium sp.]|uniref:CDF family Co(II)/Ni(II) efflux transporter DmeF n=1 Tax=Phenylobacterium sp. TaxID=1871053 RepID=UPI00271679ED|nr:CDF family Co(II)/Ni(II) efflux transporter DmeF [Phenylobacterium sp.]MDO8899758.1 CDF family Co(II)/Ni(II) efflux transporter DmeF [Phenylobacterium sp.]MDP2214807.1 CDF family Co(II)/Ni(II) efflux transporter DmeF [Phenylobacterium sp.]